LSSIPNGTIIDSAKLSLYAYDNFPNLPTYGNHYSINASTISRVISPWNEHTINWNNKPSVSSQNQINISTSTYATQDYLDINVTALVNDMMLNSNSSYGFSIQLQNEQIYKRMLFASGDHPDTNLHPKLEIYYTSLATSIEQLNTFPEANIYPNPADKFLVIDLKKIESRNISIELINTLGQTVAMLNGVSGEKAQVDISSYSQGLYFIEIHTPEGVLLKKIIFKEF